MPNEFEPKFREIEFGFAVPKLPRIDVKAIRELAKIIGFTLIG